MFGFIKKMFVVAMSFLSCNALKCVSMNNEECKIKPKIMNINYNEILFCRYSILVSKFSGSCNDINNFYAKLCVPDVLKNMNIKVFNQISRTNKARYVSWLKTCNYKCRLDASICNTKRRCNNDKCGCECKELIGKGRCDNEFVTNPSKYECDKSCNLAEGCSQNIDGH